MLTNSLFSSQGVVAFAFDEQSVGEVEWRQMYHGSHGKGILDDILEVRFFSLLLDIEILGEQLRCDCLNVKSFKVSRTQKGFN